MNSLEFCYWLQGFAETSESKEINEEQWNIIKNKLNSVTQDNSYGFRNLHPYQPIMDGEIRVARSC